MPRLLPPVLPLLGIWIHTINLDDGGALCQVGSDDDLRKVNEKKIEWSSKMRTGTVMSSFTCWILCPADVVFRPSNSGVTRALLISRCTDWISSSAGSSSSCPRTISSSPSSSSNRALSSWTEREATSIFTACCSAFSFTFLRCSSSLFSASHVMTSRSDQ